MPKLGPVLIVLAAFMPLVPTAAHASPVDVLLGVAGAYNVYTSGNMGGAGDGKAYSSDSQGAIAVGGDAYLRSFGAYSTLRGFSSDILVGGNLDLRNGQINGSAAVGGNLDLHNGQINGSATVGGTLNLENGQVKGGATVLGGTQPASPSPYGSLSFAATSSALMQASSILGGFGANGTVANVDGELRLTGSQTGLNVFDLKIDDLSGINGLKIAAPTASTVLVNVTGSTLEKTNSALHLTNFGFFLNGVGASNILFNFEHATALSFAGLGWQGSILAPGAAVMATNGHFNGSVIVKSLEGKTYQNAEFHNQLFNGNITTTPVPGPIAGAGLPVLVVLGGLVWARSRKTAAAA